MNKIVKIIFILLFTLQITSKSQDDDLYTMTQIDNTQNKIKEYFKNSKITFKTDTAYVFIVPPMGCARCEGLIDPIISYLKKFNVKSDILVVAIYDKHKSAEQYLKRRDFDSDYNLITDKTFLNSFWLSVERLSVPFFTKFNVKTGELIIGQALLGFTADSVNILKIIEASKPSLKLVSISNNTTDHSDKITCNLSGSEYLNYIKNIKLTDSKEYPFSKTSFFSINPSGTYFSILDDLTLLPYIFDLRTGKLLNVLVTDSVEEMSFVSVSKDIFKYLKDINVLNTMYFNNSFMKNDELIISTSLPKLVMEGENIGYYNAAVVIEKNIFTNKLNRIINFSPLPDTLFSLSHTNSQFLLDNEKIFVPVSKGWPTKGTEMLDSTVDKNENPFMNEFYFNIPIGALYDTGGNFIRYFGNLNNIYKQLKLGYLFCNPLLKIEDSKIWLTDRYSGKIYKYNNFDALEPKDTINVFEVTLKPADISYREKPLEYIQQTFKMNFTKQISDLTVINNKLYSLIKEDECFYIKIIDLDNTDVILKKNIPFIIEGRKIQNALLRLEGNNVVVCALYDDFRETFYTEFEVSN